MDPFLRAAIAYIVARLVTGEPARTVLDRTAGDLKRFTGQVSAREVNVFDYQRRHHVAGVPRGDAIDLYDHHTGHRVLLQLLGTRFVAFDYASRQRCEGEVSRTQVLLYDPGTRGRYEYELR